MEANQLDGLLSIPAAAALQVVVKEIWRATAPGAEPSQTS
jgi:hypothetical protein